MAYIQRAAESAICQSCGKSYMSNNRRRRYCSNTCNVVASQRRKSGKKPETAVSGPVVARASFEIPERIRDLIGPVEPSGRIFYITDETGKHIQLARYYSKTSIFWLVTGNPMGSPTDYGYTFSCFFYVGDDGSLWLSRKLEITPGTNNSREYFQVETIDTERMRESAKQDAIIKHREVNHLFWYDSL